MSRVFDWRRLPHMGTCWAGRASVLAWPGSRIEFYWIGNNLINLIELKSIDGYFIKRSPLMVVLGFLFWSVIVVVVIPMDFHMDVNFFLTAGWWPSSQNGAKGDERVESWISWFFGWLPYVCTLLYNAFTVYNRATGSFGWVRKTASKWTIYSYGGKGAMNDDCNFWSLMVQECNCRDMCFFFWVVEQFSASQLNFSY